MIARLNKGGTSKFIQLLSENLPQHDYEIIIATGFVQDNEFEIDIPPSMNIIRIPKLGRKISLINDFKSLIKLWQVIRDTKPDIIYSHTFKAGLISRITNSKIPLIHAYHGHLFYEPTLNRFELSVLTFIERILARRTTLIVTVGQKVGNEIKSRRIGLKTKFMNIPPGIPIQEIPSKQEALKRLGLSDHDMNISWVARLAPVKSPERFIELSKYFPDARFLLSGDGALLNTIKQLKTDNLEILGWQDSINIWAVSDIVVSTSYNEGMPISLIEAQLSGIPVLALDVGSVREVVIHGETGFVFPTFGQDFILALQELINDRNKLSEMGLNAKKLANKRFSLDVFVERHIKIFTEALFDSTPKVTSASHSLRNN